MADVRSSVTGGSTVLSTMQGRGRRGLRIGHGWYDCKGAV